MRAGLISAAVLSFVGLAASPASAGPALLFEPVDGKVFYAEDIDNHWHPASLTKVMTAYLVFQALEKGQIKLDQVIPCSKTAFRQPPSKVGLQVGQGMTVETALKALIIKSANDVAVMLAEAVSGSEQAFVAEMNATAKRLGMTRTRFSNPNGLPAADQITTARDLARLARAVIKDFPGYAAYWAMPSMQLGKAKLGSHNGLLRTFEGADGMKTGFICDSGFNIVASATREGQKLIAVVLGEPNANARSIRAASLLEHGYQQLGWKALFNNTTIENLPVAGDAKGIVSVRQTVDSWGCNPEARAAAKRAAAKAKAEAKAKAKAKAKSNAQAKADSKAQADAKPKTGTKAQADTKPKAGTKAQTQPSGGSTAATANPKATTPAGPAAVSHITPGPRGPEAESAPPAKPVTADATAPPPPAEIGTPAWAPADQQSIGP